VDSNTVLTGQSTSTITNLNFAQLNGCVAEGKQNLKVAIYEPTSNCQCCEVTTSESIQINHSLVANATSSSMIFKWQIETSAAIKVDNNFAVSGILCSGVDSVGCLQNIRFTEIAPWQVLTNNNVEITRNFPIPTIYTTPILTYRAFFQVLNSGFQNISATMYKNGVSIGTGNLSGTFTTNSNYQIPIIFSQAQNFNEAGVIYKVVYYAS
jgi:hypothetical protein